jgi:eukaryotic-like serine/threonine-protein kinase
MRLSAGDKLGPYEILGPLGAGGMGEVHRAHDSRLGRDVAIKVSQGNFTERFDREARAIAKLNHSHICTIYDVGPNYLVMELIEGETLAARLKKGPLPLDQAIRYGSQIATAIAAAHAKGVIHRDLKPANIMLTKSGIKVLDFGLAKSSVDETITMENVVRGTPAYMSPEQREGKELDARSDTYSLGLVLAEMAIGKRAPIGESPNLAGLPAHLRHILERCLTSAPDARWQSAQDLSAELEWAAKHPFDEAAPQSKLRPHWIWAIAALTLAAIAAVIFFVRDRPPVATPMTAEFTLLAGDSADEIAESNQLPKPSPDGRYLAMSSSAADGKTILWLRPVDSRVPRPVLGTEGVRGQSFCWSHDGRSIAFFADGKLRKVSIDGGAAQTIATLPEVQELIWGTGEIIYRPSNRKALYRIPESGGAPSEITRLDTERAENSHRGLSFLPDGRRFIYSARCAQRENNALYLGSLDTGNAKRLMPIQSQAGYVPAQDGKQGRLVYYHEAALVSRALDLGGETVLGEPIPVYQGVDYNATGMTAAFSISADGRVTVLRAGATQTHLTWHQRSGVVSDALGPPDVYTQPRISPDGSHVLASGPDPQTGNRDIFVIEVARNTSSRLTTNVANDWHPVWSPEGKRFLFGSDRDGGATSKSYAKLSLDPGAEERPYPGQAPVDWSRDGKWISYTTSTAIWVAPASPDGKPVSYLQRQFQEYGARFAPPDSRWLAYTSNETGPTEVFVRPFTGGPAPAEGKIRISTGGGDFPVWKQDGTELYFMSPAGDIFAAETQSLGRSQTPPRVSRLFHPCEETRVAGRPGSGVSYDHAFDTIDGQRFLVKCASESRRAVTVLLNWPFAGKR